MLKDTRATRFLGTFIILTALIMTGSALVGGTFSEDDPEAKLGGPYSCCGNATCSTLNATAACPQGDSQCISNCCESACNDPDAE